LRETVTTEDGGVVVVGHRVVISLGRRPLHYINIIYVVVINGDTNTVLAKIILFFIERLLYASCQICDLTSFGRSSVDIKCY